MEQETKISKGELLLLEHGCYSDRTTDGVFKASRNFDMAEVLKKVEKNFKDSDDGWEKRHRFYTYLTTSGLLKELKVRSFHTGDYDFDIK